MNPAIQQRPSKLVAIVFDLLNPIPFGFFVAALAADLVYGSSADVMWVKSAAWLISVGLFVAVFPRLINLAHVWFPGDGQRTVHSKAAFAFYLAGIVAAIINAFVHSRDAYAVMPDGMWLSAITVALLAGAHIFVTLQQARNDHQVQS